MTLLGSRSDRIQGQRLRRQWPILEAHVAHRRVSIRAKLSMRVGEREHDLCTIGGRSRYEVAHRIEDER